MRKNDLIILCAGENANMVSNLINENRITSQYNIIGYLDDETIKIGSKINGVEVLGMLEDWKNFPENLFTSPLISSPKSNHKKHQALDKLKIPTSRFVNIISSNIILPNTLKMHSGNLILSGVEFQNNISLGSHIYVSNNSVICSGTNINDYVNISNSVSIQGGVKIDKGAYLGAKCSIIGYTHIGKWSIIGMGAVVINPVKDYEIVAGNPARVIGINQAAIDYFEK